MAKLLMVEQDAMSPGELIVCGRHYHLERASANSPSQGPVWFQSGHPQEDRDFLEKGITTHYSLHIDSVNGNPANAEDYQQVAELLEIKFEEPLAPKPVEGSLTSTDEARIRAWLGCDDAEVDDDGDVWVQYPMRGQWLTAEQKARYLDLREQGQFKDVPVEAANAGRLFGYQIDLDERGYFEATVYSDKGEAIASIRAGASLDEDETSIFEDGFMRDKHDLKGLTEYLQSLGEIPADGQVLTMDEFEQRLSDVQSSEVPETRAGKGLSM